MIFIRIADESCHWLANRGSILSIDVAMIQVSPPDKHGYCTLGASVDIARAAVDCARHIIALVNPRMPRTHGDGFVHVSDIDAFVWEDRALPEVNYGGEATSIVERIGENVASLIPDGATLQMGIGHIPDQVLKNLYSHKDLGLHSEMFSGKRPISVQKIKNAKPIRVGIMESVICAFNLLQIGIFFQ